MSDPDLNHARHALASLDHLVVQDIFMTETAWLADVVLPATAWPEKTGTVSNTDRMVQMGKQAITPPGDAKAWRAWFKSGSLMAGFSPMMYMPRILCGSLSGASALCMISTTV